MQRPNIYEGGKGTNVSHVTMAQLDVTFWVTPPTLTNYYKLYLTHLGSMLIFYTR